MRTHRSTGRGGEVQLFVYTSNREREWAAQTVNNNNNNKHLDDLERRKNAVRRFPRFVHIVYTRVSHLARCGGSPPHELLRDVALTLALGARRQTRHGRDALRLGHGEGVRLVRVVRTALLAPDIVNATKGGRGERLSALQRGLHGRYALAQPARRGDRRVVARRLQARRVGVHALARGGGKEEAEEEEDAGERGHEGSRCRTLLFF